MSKDKSEDGKATTQDEVEGRLNINRITLRDIGLGQTLLTKEISNAGKPVKVALMYGRFDKAEERPNKDMGDGRVGTHLLFSGNFKAKNLLTGQTFNSARMIMPDVAAGPVGSELRMEDVQTVETGFCIIIVPGKPGKNAYEFTCQALVESNNDIFSRLEASFPKKLLA